MNSSAMKGIDKYFAVLGAFVVTSNAGSYQYNHISKLKRNNFIFSSILQIFSKPKFAFH